MPSRALRLALAQSEPAPRDVPANLASAARIIAAAGERGADLVAFPELSLTSYDLAGIAASEEAWFTAEDPRLDPVRRACAAGVTAVLGAPVRTAEGPRLAALIVDRGGVRLSSKQHLHGAEGDLFQPGEPAAPFDVAGWRVAIAVCFDAAHPRHAAAAAAAGADLYLVSAFYDAGEERRADLHLGARAMDHRMFSALVNYAGAAGGYVSCGQSGVWLPTGAVLCRDTGAGDALLVADLDPAALRPFRAAA